MSLKANNNIKGIEPPGTFDTSVEGNNETSTSVTNDTSKGRKWVITINNYTPTQMTRLIELCHVSTWWVWSREKGSKKGTPHMHAYIEFDNARHRTAIKRIVGGEFDCRKALGSKEDNLIYMSKDGDFDTNIKMYKGPVIDTFYPWEEWLLEILSQEPDDRKIYWLWEPLGNAGKTTFQKWYTIRHKDTITLSGNATDMKNGVLQFFDKNGAHPRVIFVNVPKSQHVNEKFSWGGFEQVKDMFFFSGKYEGGMVNGPPPHMVFFANKPPVIEEMSLDRWEIKDISRRDENEDLNYDNFDNHYKLFS